ncbi:MAG: biotin-dependent carboxyltransferase [Acidobacteria bacterium]|nr:biotin-dependent carboxyltransferase [Acidobacteriota bacterium]
MMPLRVTSAGFQTTVQDAGRQGYAHLGVSASGAADAVSMRFGNLLVGNPEHAPALEMTLVGGSFLFDEAAVIALTGSDFDPLLDGDSVPMWTSIPVAAGQQLSCRATKSGARCYLCISGGIRVPPVLGSASTHLMTGLGGHLGRALRAGDELELGKPRQEAAGWWRLPDQVVDRLKRRVIRVTEGPQSDVYAARALSEFASSVYFVSEDSNRMGIRLRGNPLPWRQVCDMLTEGVSLGAIQVPPDGQPIILFVEHQTTGGYPKIANVISADMHAVGQLRPRDSVRFEFVSLDTAYELLAELEALIHPRSLVPFNA